MDYSGRLDRARAATAAAGLDALLITPGADLHYLTGYRAKALERLTCLVLPAHGDPFHGLHARLDALAAGHELSLQRLEKRLAEPKRAVDVFGALFGRSIGPELLGMATGESLAHLNHLLALGEAERTTDEAGVWWFRMREA